MNNNLSLLKIISGISRTLNIANQMIPLYKQVKPLITNSNKVLSNLNTMKNNINNRIKTEPSNQNNYKQLTNHPTFFQ